MDPAVRHVSMRQGKYSLKDHIQDFFNIDNLPDLLWIESSTQRQIYPWWSSRVDSLICGLRLVDGWVPIYCGGDGGRELSIKKLFGRGAVGLRLHRPRSWASCGNLCTPQWCWLAPCWWPLVQSPLARCQTHQKPARKMPAMPELVSAVKIVAPPEPLSAVNMAATPEPMSAVKMFAMPEPSAIMTDTTRSSATTTGDCRGVLPVYCAFCGG